MSNWYRASGLNKVRFRRERRQLYQFAETGKEEAKVRTSAPSHFSDLV
jgi:hypothetical protein